VKKRRKKRKASIIVPVVSMGDIAFLLIIFFMVCSNFARESGKPIEPPKSPDIDKMKERMVSVAIDEDGNVYLKGVPVDSQEIEAGVAALLKDKEKEEDRIVLFKCDRKVDREVYEPVIAAIARGGGLIGAIGEKGEAVDKTRKGRAGRGR
jgi:biopolymer transport protein ExbD